MQFYKIISIFHKDHSKKPITTLPKINSASHMAKTTTKATVKSLNTIKRKYNRLAKAFVK